MSGILLVHGAWHGPWCWDAFADRLAGRGHQVHAVELRGHDHAPGRIWHRVHHYLDDVRQAAARFPEPPVLVGHSRRVRTPVLVLGAERDGFFTAGEVHGTARAYRTRAEIVPGIGHDMMLDDGWEKVADRVDAWAQEVGMRRRPGTLS